MGLLGRQNDSSRAIGGDGEGINCFIPYMLPGAFHLTENAVVFHTNMVKMSARMRCKNEMIFSVHLHAAHHPEHPFQHSAFGIVIQGSDAALAWVPSQLSHTVVAPALGMNSQPGISSFSSIL